MLKKVRSLRIHHWSLGDGIRRSIAFEMKGLAEFTINVGTRCSHGCLYCSSPSVLRRHGSFKVTGENPFEAGYAIVDPDIPAKVAKDAARLEQRGRVMICTTTDGWCPAAQEHQLGSRCLEAVLAEPDWSVRVTTKNAAVADDFDLIKRHRDRVLLGLSITATPDKADIMSVVEPNASPIPERMEVMRKAHREGLRTYAMFCPLLPGIANSPEQIEQLVSFAESIGAEEVIVEAANPRGKGFVDTEKALRAAGFEQEAKAVGAIRKRVYWSEYVMELVSDVQQVMRRHGMIDKLRFLLYPARLLQGDKYDIKKDDEGVVWIDQV